MKEEQIILQILTVTKSETKGALKSMSRDNGREDCITVAVIKVAEDFAEVKQYKTFHGKLLLLGKMFESKKKKKSQILAHEKKDTIARLDFAMKPRILKTFFENLKSFTEGIT